MTFYAYVYHDDITPIYVGKGKNERAFIHLKKCHNTHLKNKLAKMKRDGREPRIQIIDAPDEAAAFEMEELLIAMIGRLDLGTGPLLNKRDGGEGGFALSSEMRAQISNKLTGKKKSPQHIANVAAANLGKTRSPAACANMSAAKKGKKLSVEHCAKLSAAKSRSKPCTVDGITIYESRKALINALGQGKAGAGHPQFSYVPCKGNRK